MRVKFAVIFSATFMVVACGKWLDSGKKEKKSTENAAPSEPNQPAQTPTPVAQVDRGTIPTAAVEEKALEMSKADLVDFGEAGFKSYYSLGVAYPFHYDDEKQESKLVFTATGFSKTQTVDLGAKYPMTYCNDDSRYFFMRRNIKKVPLGPEGYKNSDAEVYLKDGDRSIAVGRYFPQYPSDGTLRQWEKTQFPRLCEGDYASVCRVSVSIAGEGNIPGERFQTIFRFYLKDGDKETLLVTATTPTKTKFTEGQHFGCDLL